MPPGPSCHTPITSNDPDALDAGPLALTQQADGGESVAKQRRSLELARRRGGAHLGGDAALDFAETTAQEGHHLLDDQRILLVRDAAVAGSERTFHRVLQAG